MTETDSPPGDSDAVPSGSEPLDYILGGGYASSHIHLLEGAPGCGKTTLGLQFLMDGRTRGERGLYITLSESRDELHEVARTHGWNLDGIDIFELIPPELSVDPEREQSIVYASDLELGETIRLVMEEIERLAPSRVVFDSLSEIRVLAQGSLRYRRQVLALKHFFARRRSTALFLDDLTDTAEDLSLHSLAHGVIRLEQIAMAPSSTPFMPGMATSVTISKKRPASSSRSADPVRKRLCRRPDLRRRAVRRSRAAQAVPDQRGRRAPPSSARRRPGGLRLAVRRPGRRERVTVPGHNGTSGPSRS